MDLPESHPARRLLVSQAECRNECVAREIWWEGLPGKPIDQEWTGQAAPGRWKFSSLAYAYVSFSLVVTGWLKHPPEIAPDEQLYFKNAPIMLALLQECEAAALVSKNTDVLPLIDKVREFVQIWEIAVRTRLSEDRIEWPQCN